MNWISTEREYFFSNLLNIFLVIYAILLPFSNAFTTFSAPCILLILWIAEGNLSEKFKKILSQKPAIFLLFFLIFNILSLLWTTNIQEGIHTLKYYIAFTVIFITITTSLKNTYSKIIIYAFLLSMFVSEILLYGVMLDLWKIGQATPSNPSPIMHHVLYSIFIAVTIFFLIWQIKCKNTKMSYKILEILFLISTTSNLFINSGRTGQIAVVIGIFVFAISYYGIRWKKITSIFLFLFFMIMIAYNLSPNFKNRILMAKSDIHKISKGDLNNSWGLRIAMKILGYKIVMDHPLVGVGIGDVLDVKNAYLSHSDMKKYLFLKNIIHFHDQYLQILLQTGLIGLFLFLTFIYSIFHESYKDQLSKSILFSVMSVYIFSFFADVPLRNYVSGLFGFSIAILYIYAKGYQKETA